MRLIDADAIISQCKEYSNLLKYDGTTDREWAVVKRIILIIKEQPTIEPRCETCEAFNKTRLLIPQPERKKGKWIPVTRIYKVTEGQFPNTHIEWVDATEPNEIDAVRCSECREVFDFQDARNWCTECGADMRDSVETARDIVHEAVNNSVWSDTVDTAKMHKVVDDKYAEMTKKTEESNRCDTCKHEKERWFNCCADCFDYELWEGKEE